MIQMTLDEIQMEMHEIHEKMKAQNISTEAAMVGAFITILAMAFRADTPARTQEVILNTAQALVGLSTAIILHLASEADLESPDEQENEQVCEPAATGPATSPTKH